MRAHLKTDRFLRGCFKARRYDGIACRVTLRRAR